jgi:hypothetical protein
MNPKPKPETEAILVAWGTGHLVSRFALKCNAAGVRREHEAEKPPNYAAGLGVPPSAPPPSKSIKMSRGSAPLLGPTMPRFSSSSMIRAARP